ncbi:unnamed protein product, partial [Musa hybrid cultivar]
SPSARCLRSNRGGGGGNEGPITPPHVSSGILPLWPAEVSLSFWTIEVKLAAFKSLLNSHVYYELPISWDGFGVEDIATKLRTVSVCITSSTWTAN